MKKLFLMVMLLLVVTATGCKKSDGSASGSSEASKEASKEAGTSQISDTDALLDELVESTDLVNNFEAAAVPMLQQFGINDQGLINKIKEELPKIAKDVYKKHFTGDEVKQLIELNKDEVQQKSIKMMPKIMEEAFSAGISYGNGEEAAAPAVSDDFQAAMNDYFEAEEFDKQMQQAGTGSDLSFLRNTMTSIFSKYFSADEIKHLTELSKLPISAKSRKELPAIQQELSTAIQSIVMNYMNK